MARLPGDKWVLDELAGQSKSVATFSDISELLKGKGKYPLYDAQVQVVDLDEWRSYKGKLTAETLPLTRKVISLGTLVPRVTILRPETLELPGDKDHKEYNIFMTARNGVFSQKLALRRVKESWKRAIKVSRNLEDREVVLLERKDEDYPKE